MLRRVGGCVDAGRKEKINKSNTSRSSREIYGRCTQDALSSTDRRTTGLVAVDVLKSKLLIARVGKKERWRTK